MFDEAACIEPFLAETVEALIATGRRFELICVDDGSRDETLLHLKADNRAPAPPLLILEQKPRTESARIEGRPSTPGANMRNVQSRAAP